MSERERDDPKSLKLLLHGPVFNQFASTQHWPVVSPLPVPARLLDPSQPWFQTSQAEEAILTYANCSRWLARGLTSLDEPRMNLQKLFLKHHFQSDHCRAYFSRYRWRTANPMFHMDQWWVHAAWAWWSHEEQTSVPRGVGKTVRPHLHSTVWTVLGQIKI